MNLAFIRVFFLAVITAVGFFIGSIYRAEVVGLCLGALTGVVLVLLESTVKRVSVRGLSSMVFGLLLGVFMAKLVADVISLLPLGDGIIYPSRVVLTLIFSYLGSVMALRGKDEFHVIIPYVRFKRQDAGERIVLLDTSAIIDERVFQIYKTRFFDDRLVVPRFVLQELQALADSQDDIKRDRGRRGLAIVDQMRRDEEVDLRIHEDDFARETGVDAKLVRLARLLEARICTTDYNLGQVAKIQEVAALNIHELAAALQPRLVMGDRIELVLTRQGKEPDQAVGYTSDGTMVVVAGAAGHVGETVSVEVTSRLKTQGGEMLFARMV